MCISNEHVAVAILVVLLGAACTTTAPDADEPRSPDAASSATDVDTENTGDQRRADAGASECSSPADCVQRQTNQVLGCWACTNKKCVALSANTDPNGACAGTACTTSTCNGLGACTPPVAKAIGTSCGVVCGVGPIAGGGLGHGVWAGICQGSTCVADHGDGSVPATVSCSTEYCSGPKNSCEQCPATGCVAKCASAASDHCP